MDFNYGHGIEMSYFKQAGNIFVLKRQGIYMFVLKDKRLYLLEGGRKRKLDNDIDYYYENMPVYQAQVRNAFEPYNSALKKIAKEVKAFGGAGTIHGCIVDIDFLNHIYLNPFDGKITPYFAWDMTTKLMYDNVSDLLEASPSSYLFFDEPALLENFAKASSAGLTPILACQKSNADTALATVPEIILDRTMYEPSRIMRSIQYIFDQNVIRVWNDNIIKASFDNAPAALDGSLPQLPAKK